ncbi:hypothetical protein KEM56_003193 [Ascosphaera pollenicola]|nr:hypothetical protein KEM56_003193 [Ascosphaera pollenicola]
MPESASDASQASERLGLDMTSRLLQNFRSYLKMDPIIIAAALLPIYVGAHAALSRPPSAKKPLKRKTKSREDGEDTEDEEGLSTLMTGGSKLQASDAVLLPLSAGAILCLFYWIIMSSESGAKVLNQVLGIHVGLTGTVFLRTFLNDIGNLIRSFVFPTRYSFVGKHWKVEKEKHRFVAWGDESKICNSPFPGVLCRLPLGTRLNAAAWKVRNTLYCKLEFCFHIHHVFSIETELTPIGMLSSVASFATIYYFTFINKFWWLTNLLGTASAYGAMALMSPATFGTGSLILGVLFFYDIYMVFYTPMMVTVATKLDIPAKLLFPKTPSKDQAPGEKPPMSMLGLGDIVIPGMMIALALKFDLYLFFLRKQTKRVTRQGESIEKPPYINVTGNWGERFWCAKATMPSGELEAANARAFPKTYFYASILGYIVAMMVCGFWMALYNYPQPALLYLVPGVLGAIWGTAFVRGELKTMIDYSEVSESEEEEGKERKAAEEKAEKQRTNEDRNKKQGLFSKLFSDLWRGSSAAEEEKEKEKSSKDAEAQEDPTKPTYLVKFYLRSPPKQKPRKTTEEDSDKKDTCDGPAETKTEGKTVATLDYMSIDNTVHQEDDKEVSAPKRRKTRAVEV